MIFLVVVVEPISSNENIQFYVVLPAHHIISTAQYKYFGIKEPFINCRIAILSYLKKHTKFK